MFFLIFDLMDLMDLIETLTIPVDVIERRFVDPSVARLVGVLPQPDPTHCFVFAKKTNDQITTSQKIPILLMTNE
jgi:hypothetical protein